uniref:X8 domain-containing protein n=1 Tax=Opuntia streptacantha TaxID=393608 RepID=A0A7C8YTW0_OPUST
MQEHTSLSVSLPLFCLLLVFLGQISGGLGCSDWCLASKEAPDELVQKALDWVCSYGTACGRIQPGQPCYRPNDLRGVASVAFNQYWQDVKSLGTPCEKIFNVTTLVHTDPSNNSSILLDQF